MRRKSGKSSLVDNDFRTVFKYEDIRTVKLGHHQTIFWFDVGNGVDDRLYMLFKLFADDGIFLDFFCYC